MGEPHPFRVARVLAWRRRRLPAFQIARAAKLSKASVSRLLRRHRARLAALEPPPPVRRSARAHPGELIHFDLKKLARSVRPGHRVTGDRQHDHTRGAGWEFLHIAIDDHSRLAFAQLLPDETAASAIAFLHNYNWHRPHHSLNLRSPISRLRHSLNNLLSLHI